MLCTVFLYFLNCLVKFVQNSSVESISRFSGLSYGLIDGISFSPKNQKLIETLAKFALKAKIVFRPESQEETKWGTFGCIQRKKVLKMKIWWIIHFIKHLERYKNQNLAELDSQFSTIFLFNPFATKRCCSRRRQMRGQVSTQPEIASQNTDWPFPQIFIQA